MNCIITAEIRNRSYKLPSSHLSFPMSQWMHRRKSEEIANKLVKRWESLHGRGNKVARAGDEQGCEIARAVGLPCLWTMEQALCCKRNETQGSLNSQSTTDLIQRYAPDKETFEYVYQNIGVATPVKRRTRKTKAVFRDFVLF